MNLTSIGSSTGIEGLKQVRTASASKSAAAPPAGDSLSLSGATALSSKLEALSKSDPAKFKKAMDEVATKLTDQANASTDPKEKETLQNLAGEFTKAGETGDVSGLKPQHHSQSGHGGGAPPAGGAGAGGASQTSQTSQTSETDDPADTNQDGVVTVTERQAYEAKQQSAITPQQAEGLSTYQRVAHSGDEQKASALFSTVNSVLDQVMSTPTAVQGI